MLNCNKKIMACSSCGKNLNEKLGKCNICMMMSLLSTLLFLALYLTSNFIFGQGVLNQYIKPVFLFFSVLMGLLFIAHIFAYLNNNSIK